MYGPLRFFAVGFTHSQEQAWKDFCSDTGRMVAELDTIQ